MASAKTTYLCAVKLWGMFPGTQTLRRGVRSVARKQGLSPAEMDKAERQLVKSGLVTRGGRRTGASIGLTQKGVRVATRACRRVRLPPWT